MRNPVLVFAALALSACSTGGASGANRPYPSPSPSGSHPGSPSVSTARSGRGGYDAQDVSLDAAIAGGRAAGKPVALYLFSATCGWCRKLEGETLPDSTVRSEMASFYNVRIGAESAAGRQVTGHYNVHAFPTVVFPDASGGKRTRDIEGYSQPVNFASRLRKAH